MASLHVASSSDSKASSRARSRGTHTAILRTCRSLTIPQNYLPLKLSCWFLDSLLDSWGKCRDYCKDSLHSCTLPCAPGPIVVAVVFSKPASLVKASKYIPRLSRWRPVRNCPAGIQRFKCSFFNRYGVLIRDCSILGRTYPPQVQPLRL